MKYYHGANKKKSYFEGWYFKHQLKDKTITFIPGISMDSRGEKAGFVQIITNEQTYNVPYSPAAFCALESRLGIRVGRNVFSQKGVSVNIQTPEVCIRGKIKYGRLTPVQYDMMGPFCVIPFMECSHGVLSLCHTLSGTLHVNGESFKLDGGTGYIETDWGSSFPKSYLWTQCSVPEQKCCVMASAAEVPFVGMHFRGCVAVVWYKGKEYRFATYLGVKIMRYSEKSLQLEQGKLYLAVDVLEQSPQALAAPVLGNMKRTIHESVSCRVRYRFYINDKKVFDFTSPYASFEYVEDCNIM